MNNLKNTIELILKAFTGSNFQLFINSLLTLQEEVIKLDPENLDAGLVDLCMDENMWSWASSAIGRDPTEFDWEAAQYIAADLTEILNSPGLSVSAHLKIK